MNNDMPDVLLCVGKFWHMKKVSAQVENIMQN